MTIKDLPGIYYKGLSVKANWESMIADGFQHTRAQSAWLTTLFASAVNKKRKSENMFIRPVQLS